MLSTPVATHGLDLNKKGFLVRFEDWDKDVAEALAAENGLELTECHWVAIDFFRDYFQTYDVPPSPRVLIQTIGDKLSQGAPCTRKTLSALFPEGGCKQACRIAGLPNYYCNAC
jgi:tRNA 2-thiouridine synthesizing protein E